MDLRAYFQKIRNIEAEIAEPYVVVVSRETPDGGKPGVKTDVPRGLAAKLIVEDQATLASAEETARIPGGDGAAADGDCRSGSAVGQVPKAVAQLETQGKRQ